MYFTVPAVTKCRNDSRHKSENFTHVHISSTLHFMQNMEKQNKGEEKTTTKTNKHANRKENNTIQARSDQTESQRQYVDQIIRNCRSWNLFLFFYNTMIVCLPFPRKSRFSFSSKRLLSKKPSVFVGVFLSVYPLSEKTVFFLRMCVMDSLSLSLSYYYCYYYCCCICIDAAFCHNI